MGAAFERPRTLPTEIPPPSPPSTHTQELAAAEERGDVTQGSLLAVCNSTLAAGWAALEGGSFGA